jgi:hypothetical protein
LRDNTERPVTCDVGVNRLVGSDPQAGLAAALEILERGAGPMSIPPLWDGHAAERIVDDLDGPLRPNGFAFMKALVTGGAGFIGSHICDALVARGDDVVVLDNFASRSRGQPRASRGADRPPQGRHPPPRRPRGPR